MKKAFSTLVLSMTLIASTLAHAQSAPPVVTMEIPLECKDLNLPVTLVAMAGASGWTWGVPSIANSLELAGLGEAVILGISGIYGLFIGDLLAEQLMGPEIVAVDVPNKRVLVYDPTGDGWDYSVMSCSDYKQSRVRASAIGQYAATDEDLVSRTFSSREAAFEFIQKRPGSTQSAN